jgi:hypothetical protein
MVAAGNEYCVAGELHDPAWSLIDLGAFLTSRQELHKYSGAPRY